MGHDDERRLKNSWRKGLERYPLLTLSGIFDLQAEILLLAVSMERWKNEHSSKLECYKLLSGPELEYKPGHVRICRRDERHVCIGISFFSYSFISLANSLRSSCTFVVAFSFPKVTVPTHVVRYGNPPPISLIVHRLLLLVPAGSSLPVSSSRDAVSLDDGWIFQFNWFFPPWRIWWLWAC